jgi:hypothetical protein
VTVRRRCCQKEGQLENGQSFFVDFTRNPSKKEGVKKGGRCKQKKLPGVILGRVGDSLRHQVLFWFQICTSEEFIP